MPTRKTQPKPIERRTEFTGFRFTKTELDEIRARAAKRGMTVTEYVTKAALGILEADPTSTQRQIDQLEDRIRELERLAELGALG